MRVLLWSIFSSAPYILGKWRKSNPNTRNTRYCGELRNHMSSSKTFSTLLKLSNVAHLIAHKYIRWCGVVLKSLPLSIRLNYPIYTQFQSLKKRVEELPFCSLSLPGAQSTGTYQEPNTRKEGRKIRWSVFPGKLSRSTYSPLCCTGWWYGHVFSQLYF